MNGVAEVFVQEGKRRTGLGGLVGRRRSSISVDSDESGRGYGSTSSSRRALSPYSYRGPPPLPTNPAKGVLAHLSISVASH